MKTANKGEWSELYAFIKLLSDGKIYAADENVNKIESIYFPILKLLREENPDSPIEYYPGDKIKIFQNGVCIDEFGSNSIEQAIDTLFHKIFEGSNTSAAFSIEEAETLMDQLHIEKIKAPSLDKRDLTLQIHDINTGYQPIVGFSAKSDVGNPPTLMNAGKNTRFTYKINGITDSDMNEINSINKTVIREYMVARMQSLHEKASSIEYYSMKDETFEDNLVLIDSYMPQLYGNMILFHYLFIAEKIYDCGTLCDLLEKYNPLNYRRPHTYSYKIKKLLCAAALGMTPGHLWDGLDNASGGYIIIKRDGDVLCYHIYNRNFFEEYLLKNTQFDRPSASRYDYGYIYKIGDEYFIDLNVQIRFKSITSASKDSTLDDAMLKRLSTYAKLLKDNLSK